MAGLEGVVPTDSDMTESQAEKITDLDEELVAAAAIDSLAVPIVRASSLDSDSDDSDASDTMYYRTKPKKVHAYLDSVFPDLKNALKYLDLLDLNARPDVVDSMVCYIETGKMDLNSEMIEGFLKLSTKLKLDNLLNAWEIKEMALFHSDTRVLGIMDAYIKSHFDAATNNIMFLEKSKQEILKLFENWKIIAPSIEAVDKGLRKWASHDPVNRKDFYKTFFKTLEENNNKCDNGMDPGACTGDSDSKDEEEQSENADAVSKKYCWI